MLIVATGFTVLRQRGSEGGKSTYTLPRVNTKEGVMRAMYRGASIVTVPAETAATMTSTWQVKGAAVDIAGRLCLGKHTRHTEKDRERGL